MNDVGLPNQPADWDQPATTPYFIKFFVFSQTVMPNGLEVPVLLTMFKDQESAGPYIFYASKVNPGQILRDVVAHEVKTFFGTPQYYLANVVQCDTALTKDGKRLPRLAVHVFVPGNVAPNTSFQFGWLGHLSKRLDEIEVMQLVIQMCQSLMRQAKTMDIALDGSEASVDALETMFERLSDPQTSWSGITAMFGSYLLTLMMRFCGAKLIKHPEHDEWQLSLSGKDGLPIRTSPFNKVQKRIDNGPEDSLSFYYLATKNLMLHGLPDKPSNFETGPFTD